MGPSALLLLALPGTLLVLSAQLPLASANFHVDICRLPPVTGPCLALYQRWYYNPRSRRCDTFTYGGCKGNANNFQTLEACRCRCARRVLPPPVLPTPVLPPPVKYGECPPWFEDSEELCGEFCSTDASCPGTERCCKTKCGHSCKQVLEASPGYCPRVTIRDGWATICLVSCSSDMDCGWSGELPRRKCCSFGCHVRCSTAEEEHPGVCPARKVVQTFAPCNNTCDDDRDCALHKKCCFNGCSRRCLEPVRSYRCQLPYKTGPCRAYMPRYYYDPSQKRCRRFIYGGCEGNSNNFRTRKACEEACGRISPEVCKLPGEPGPCLGYSPMYYHNSTTKTCETFIFGLCGGNANRFSTKLECSMVCRNQTRTKEHAEE